MDSMEERTSELAAEAHRAMERLKNAVAVGHRLEIGAKEELGDILTCAVSLAAELHPADLTQSLGDVPPVTLLAFIRIATNVCARHARVWASRKDSRELFKQIALNAVTALNSIID